MSFGNEWNKMIFLAALSGFFVILALNLFVPIVVVSVMGVVDRTLMRLWYGPPLWTTSHVWATPSLWMTKTARASGEQTA